MKCELFAAKLFELMGWRKGYKYKILGVPAVYKREMLFLFKLEFELQVCQSKASSMHAPSWKPSLDAMKKILSHLRKKIIKAFPLSGIALHPSWYKGNWSELEEVKRLVNAAKLPEGKSRNDGLVAISPTAISEMESFACNLFYLEFGSTYTVCDFLDMTEKIEFEDEELEGLTNPEAWMEERIPWITALDYSKKLSCCRNDLWLCPLEESFVLRRCDY